MELNAVKYLLIYFKCDKTFDIRRIEQTSGFDDAKLESLRNGMTVSVETVYDDEPCGVVVQVGETQSLVRSAEDICVSLKKKKWSLERIVRESGISPEVFIGGPRQRLRNTDKVFTTDAESSDVGSIPHEGGAFDQLTVSSCIVLQFMF